MAAFTVKAAQSGGSGIFLAVKVLTSARLAVTPATATENSLTLAPTASITTTTAGAQVYGSIIYTVNNTGTFTAAANNTIVDSIAGTGDTFGSTRLTAVVSTPGATAVGATAPAGNGTFGTSSAFLEVLPAGTITQDGSTPAAVAAGALSSITTASFTPPAGSLLVALVNTDVSTAVPAVTDTSGLGLVWAQRVSSTSAIAAGGAWVFTAQMPGVAFDAVGPAGSPSAGVHGTTTPLSWTHILGAAANAILVEVVNAGSNTDNVSSVTIGASNTNIPLIGTGHNASGVFCSWYGLLNPPTGSQTVKVNFTGSPNDMLAGSVSFSGAGSFGALFSANSGAGSAASQTVAVTSTTTGGMVAVAGAFGGTGFTAFTMTGSGGTLWLSDPNSSSFAGDMNAAGTYPSTGSSLTVGLSAGSGSDLWTVSAVEVLPPAGAAAPAMAMFRPVSKNFRSPRIRGPWRPHVVPFSSLASVPVSDSDTATAADSATPPGASLSDADTASASETGVIGVSASDSFAAADAAGPPNASFTSAETATATEGSPASIAFSTPDSASAADTGVIHVSDADSASAAESGAITVSTADTATAADAASPPNATLSSADTATATETGTIRVSDAETAAGTDAASPPNAALSSAETATGTEGSPVSIGVSAADSGSAADAASPPNAALSSADTASASDAGEVIHVSAADSASAAESQSVAATLSSADTASASDTASPPAASLSSADTASAAEAQSLVAHLSDADTALATDGNEGGTGGTHVSDTDSWHGEDSGFTLVSDADTASASDGNEVIRPAGADTASASDIHTIAWVQSSDTATGDDELRTLTGPAVADVDSFSAAEAVGPFPFHDSDSFAMADLFVLNVWSGMAPYTYLGGRERRIHGPDGRVVAVTSHVDPQFLRLAQKIAEAETVVWVGDADSFSAAEGTVVHDWTVSVSVAPAVRVTVEFS